MSQSLESPLIDGAEARAALAHAERMSDPAVLDPEPLFIPQRYERYTATDQDTWRKLCAAQQEFVAEHASAVYLAGTRVIELSRERIPRLADVSARLQPMTGWRSRPVPGYLPARAFFACLARRQFPTTIVIRPPDAIGYLPEPDIFHDVFGHVPLHADPVFADFLEAYGRAGLAARDPEALEELARLFWFTVEFGLVQERGELRLYGSGLISSPEESRHALFSPDVERRPFDLDEICGTGFEIDHFQPLLYVLEGFDELLHAMHRYTKERCDG